MATTTASKALSATQVQILKALQAAGKPLSREEITEVVGITASIEVLGPNTVETMANHPDSLYGRGLVEPKKTEESPITWSLTKNGKKAAEKFKSRARHNGETIPAEKLDAAVLKVRETRTYGLELFTSEDLTEVRGLCGKKFADVSDDHLRQQICNRRKQGAFADPKERIRKQVMGILRLVGPGGTLKDGLLTAKQVKDLETLLD